MLGRQNDSSWTNRNGVNFDKIPNRKYRNIKHQLLWELKNLLALGHNSVGSHTHMDFFLSNANLPSSSYRPLLAQCMQLLAYGTIYTLVFAICIFMYGFQSRPYVTRCKLKQLHQLQLPVLSVCLPIYLLPSLLQYCRRRSVCVAQLFTHMIITMLHNVLSDFMNTSSTTAHFAARTHSRSMMNVVERWKCCCVTLQCSEIYQNELFPFLSSWLTQYPLLAVISRRCELWIVMCGLMKFNERKFYALKHVTNPIPSWRES